MSPNNGNNKPSKGKYCKFSHITLKKELLESDAWARVSKSPKTVEVFIYLWSCLQWTTHKTGRTKGWDVTNNGDIEVSTVKMRDKLGVTKATCTNAIHLLIEVGLIRLTREGRNKICHKYKILYDVVPTNEQRWKKYPDKNWKDECPKSPDNLVGKKTQFKSHPNTVNRKTDNQSNTVYPNNSISLTNHTVKDDFEE